MLGQTQALAFSAGPHVCLTNSYSYCADIKNDNYASGQPVWLYNGGKADAFQAVLSGTIGQQGNNPFTIQPFDQQLSGDNYGIIYAQNSTDLCLAESGGNVQLGSCQGTGVLWVAVPDSDGSFLVNVQNSDATSQLERLTAQNVADKQVLTLNSTATGWQQWGNSGPGTGITFGQGCLPSPPCWP